MDTKLATATRKKQYSAPALEKGLDILELLSTEANGLTILEITGRLSKSVGELFRMLVVLEQRGYVATMPGTDSYALTLKVFELAHRFPPIKRLTSVASAVLRKLAFQLGQSCHVVIYYEGRGRVVVQQDSPSERALSVRLGADAPLVNTCSGHVLLAYSDDDDRQRMIASIPSYHQQMDIAELDKKLIKVKKRGHESIKSAQIQGVLDIGVPIFNHSGGVAAALVVPYLAYLDGSHSVNADSVLELVILSAGEISVALGYSTE